MRTFISGLCAAAMMLTASVGLTTPAGAVLMSVPQAAAERSDVVKVQNRRDRRDRFERRGGRAFYNGHRGYRVRRPGYRYHNGFWFPAAAFAAGALIGGAIAAPPRPVVRGSGSAHVDWCANRYRSYRASDNSYQPLSGPRRQCVSPYS